MKNKGIILFLIALAVVIVAVMMSDWLSKRPDRMEPNKFEYSVEEFRNVPDELILYREIRNFRMGFEKPAALTIAGDSIFLVGDQKLKVTNTAGQLLLEIDLFEKPTSVEVAGEKIYIAWESGIWVYSTEGILLDTWQIEGENNYLTGLAASAEYVFASNAGTRRVHRFKLDGELELSFEGKASADDLHGFIIPSPYFDIDINTYGDLWVVNPGLHTLENYTEGGNLREHWRASGARIEGFSGCCNPAHFCFLPDGSFVTSEKGLVRVKLYKPSGEFLGVVAAPTQFDEKVEGEAPDVAVDTQGNIYALDFDRKLLRVFEKK